MTGPMKIPPYAPHAATPYYSPDGRAVAVTSSMGILFSDDFGGVALDTTNNWQVLQGGYAGIGSGVNAGMTYSVASSALTVNMNTGNNDELWFMSNQIFAGSEDLLFILSKSQSLAANSIFIGLVEVDGNGNPILNPNYATDFTNRGGVELGLTTTNTAYQCEAVADSSPAKAIGLIGVAYSALNTTQEFAVEFHAEDIMASTQVVDNILGKAGGVSRLSTQVPNDGKQYKLLMRFRNVAGPGSNTQVVIQRIMVCDCQEQRVEVTSGRGDNIPQKAIAVNPSVGSTIAIKPGTASGATSATRLSSAAATTNATLVAAGAHTLIGGSLRNPTTADVYLKIYDKATAPVPGTDTPKLTICIPGASTALNSQPVSIAQILGDTGFSVTLGLGYAITNLPADNDATAVAAGAVVGMTLTYV